MGDPDFGGAPSYSWMNYSIRYHLETGSEPTNLVVHFVRTDAARPIFKIPSDGHGNENTIWETGLIDVELLIEGLMVTFPRFPGFFEPCRSWRG